MRHFISMLDSDPTSLAAIVRLARALKAGKAREEASILRGKILSMVFFNPSLRTRASFEAAMMRFGGSAITMNVGGDTWNLEHREGVVMDADKAEHVKEAAPVLSRYFDVLGVRTFGGLKDAEEDQADALIRSFARYCTVPMVSLESAMEHPCQGLADWMTVDERFSGAAGRNFTLTWAPQAKPTPMAVPNSAALAAAAAGCNLTIAHPPGYELHAHVVDKARSWCAARGTVLRITHDQDEACASADVVYVKSWGSPQFYGNIEAQHESFRQHAHWMVDTRHLRREQSILMHCLPVRRNVVITDAALDDRRCAVVDQAENRMWIQAAILIDLLRHANK
ncbi:N-acetylornithine carbamoyltransferase [Phycisphaerae bacterium RAS1]|nr:N-acetylornithine carbamoyltransferase [Phycisphaerae bacterium RAS1]